MISSMTAFTREQTQHPMGDLVWEVRSVNHKYLDTHLKLPDELRGIESACREKIGGRLNRGRIDAQLKFDRVAGKSGELAINHSLLSAVTDALHQIEQNNDKLTPTRSIELLRWPGVLQEQQGDMDDLQQEAVALLQTALGSLMESRQREGVRMGQLISDRIVGCRQLVAELRGELPDIDLSLQQRWQDKLSSLSADIDENRLHQELAIMLTKTDISEELDRLDSHFHEVDAVLASKKPAGRRLDFLMQELNREANTLGSKSADTRNTRTAMELKVLIDQMREQVQNIE